MKITANFSGTNNQFEVWDQGPNNTYQGLNPPLNGRFFTNFSCDLMFAPGSATTVSTNGGTQLWARAVRHANLKLWSRLYWKR